MVTTVEEGLGGFEGDRDEVDRGQLDESCLGSTQMSLAKCDEWAPETQTHNRRGTSGDENWTRVGPTRGGNKGPRVKEPSNTRGRRSSKDEGVGTQIGLTWKSEVGELDLGEDERRMTMCVDEDHNGIARLVSCLRGAELF